MNDQSTICAVATAPGIGGIAVIRLSGSESVLIADKIYQPLSKGKRLIDQSPNSMHYGNVVSENTILDDAFFSIFKAPRSYTGEDVVEISCHGSLYIQQQILQLLIRFGARMANPGEFTQRAYLNGKLDLAQAEAVADLIASTGQAAHRVAMNQMRGGISNELKQLRQQLLHFISLIELELDFSEEEVEFADRKQLSELLDKISGVVNRLIKSFSLGNAIKNGIPVAIIGEPNVGKSTLLNAILKEDRAIVSEIAGTTRDAIEDTFNLDGLTYRFIDTAGIRHTNDTIESLGIERTFQKISQAAVVFAMFDVRDSNEKIGAAIDSLLTHLPEDAVLIVVRNKADKEAIIPPKINHQRVFAEVLISAKQGKVEHLLQVLTEMMRERESEAHDVIVTNARHYNALVLANEALERAGSGLNNHLLTDLLAMDIREVIHHLAGITGEEITTDEVLGNIFKNFCIGK